MGALLRNVNLSQANLSGATGLPIAADFLSNFQRDADGVLVYRAQRGYPRFPAPPSWRFEPGRVLTETVNPDRCTPCGSGVSFGTLDFCREEHPEQRIWLCRIAWIDLADVVVPFATDGKARCARLTLLRIEHEGRTEGTEARV